MLKEESRIHEELIMHEKIARLKVLEAIKSKPDIDFGLDDKIMDGILRYSMT
ncbi:23121_t:CDS:2 [Rhizophagus irregularis]|nr:23121_t:CDS:2 [Rhizophagus irregularis]